VNTSTEPDSRVEGYMARVRAALRGMPKREREDVLRELRGHLAERAAASGGDVEAAIGSLGDPVDLARQYQAENVMARAECGHSPIRILHGLYVTRWRSVTGFLVTAAAMFGYAWGLALAAAAVDKLVEPAQVGLWCAPDRWWSATVVIDGSGPAGTHEVLGWWFVPAGLAAGMLLIFVTNRFGIWWIRRFRLSKSFRAA
jgi:hypothetical protein